MLSRHMTLSGTLHIKFFQDKALRIWKCFSTLGPRMAIGSKQCQKYFLAEVCYLWKSLELQSIALTSESKTYFYNWDYLKLSCSKFFCFSPTFETIMKIILKMFENQDTKSTFYLLCGHFFPTLIFPQSLLSLNQFYSLELIQYSAFHSRF